MWKLFTGGMGLEVPRIGSGKFSDIVTFILKVLYFLILSYFLLDLAISSG